MRKGTGTHALLNGTRAILNDTCEKVWALSALLACSEYRFELALLARSALAFRFCVPLLKRVEHRNVYRAKANIFHTRMGRPP